MLRAEEEKREAKEEKSLIIPNSFSCRNFFRFACSRFLVIAPLPRAREEFKAMDSSIAFRSSRANFLQALEVWIHSLQFAFKFLGNVCLLQVSDLRLRQQTNINLLRPECLLPLKAESTSVAIKISGAVSGGNSRNRFNDSPSVPSDWQQVSGEWIELESSMRNLLLWLLPLCLLLRFITGMLISIIVRLLYCWCPKIYLLFSDISRCFQQI